MKGQFSQISSLNLKDSGLPEPTTVVVGDSPLIFSGPHNGLAVISDPERPLGMPLEWFNKAHEAHDLNMTALFGHMMDRFPDASFIWSNYSRLVVDVNRLPNVAIAETSSEWDNIIIPGNAPDIVTPEERESRMNAIYWPYHDALVDLVAQTREKFGYAQLIDMHSFSPIWIQRIRQSEIGMLTMEEEHPLAEATSTFLAEHSGMTYIHRQPYSLPDRREITAAPMIRERINGPYVGLEIRNNMISDESGQKRICDLMAQYLAFMANHPKRELFFEYESENEIALQTSEPEADEETATAPTTPGLA